MKNAFIISLDYELYWGIRDHTSLEKAKHNLIGTRKVIPSILSLFEKYNIACTWATVGFLFAKDKIELLESLPASLPQYLNEKFSPYPTLEEIGNTELADPHRLGLEPLIQISKTNKQEIGTHTFSHYYCLEKGQTEINFEDDLIACNNLSIKRFGKKMESIVFPRNQFNDNYLQVLKRLGIKYYRGNRAGKLYKADGYDTSSSIKLRVLRLLDRYINISGYGAFDTNKVQQVEGLINLPGSRFFAPYSKKLFLMEWLKISRIKREMLYAAKNNLSYHLWWHPENFGTNSDQNLKQLESILAYYLSVKEKYGMENLSMNQF